MSAEKVYADQISVGDRIWWCDQIVPVLRITREFRCWTRAGRYLECEVHTQDGQSDERRLHYFDAETVKRESS